MILVDSSSCVSDCPLPSCRSKEPVLLCTDTIHQIVCCWRWVSTCSPLSFALSTLQTAACSGFSTATNLYMCTVSCCQLSGLEICVLEYLLCSCLCSKCTQCRYTVTGSLCLVAAKRAVCFHEHGGSHKAPCSFDNVPWMIMFGAIQLV